MTTYTDVAQVGIKRHFSFPSPTPKVGEIFADILCGDNGHSEKKKYKTKLNHCTSHQGKIQLCFTIIIRTEILNNEHKLTVHLILINDHLILLLI